jgi:hypothetical protein
MPAPDFIPAPGETVRWTGHPDPAVIFAPGDVVLVPFSLVWTAFAVFWETTAVQRSGQVIFLVFGGAFVLVGLYFVVGRFFYKAWRKGRTTYAITSTRVVEVRPRGSRELRLPTPGLSETPNRDGRHISVVFEGPPRTRSFGFGSNSPPAIFRNTGWGLGSEDGSIGFYDVDDVDGLASAVATLRTSKETA